MAAFMLVCNIPDKGSVELGRFILNVDPPLLADHKLDDKLDCRRENLRTATVTQKNRGNMRKINTIMGNRVTSKFKGVFWEIQTKKWRAGIQYQRKSYKLGRFVTELEAAKAYDLKAKELFGAFASLNLE